MRGDSMRRPAGKALPTTDEHLESTEDVRLATTLADEGKRLIADPRGEVSRLEHVAQRGESAATPMIAISGVVLFIGIVFVVVLGIAFAAYFLSL
jgi:hypothetical protein